MFRVRVAASLFVIMAGLSVGLYFYLGSHAAQQTEAGLTERLAVARSSLQRSRSLTDHWILARAEAVAAWPQLGAALAIKPESMADEEGNLPDPETFAFKVQEKVDEEMRVWVAKFKAVAEGSVERRPGLVDWRVEKPDFFWVVNAKGQGVAKSSDPAGPGKSERDVLSDHPALAMVLTDGQPVIDVWIDKKPMTVAAAPVLHGGRVVGAVLIGYRMTTSESAKDKAVVGADVAYFVGTTLSQTSSLATGTEAALQAALASQKLIEQASKDPLVIELEGAQWMVAVARHRGYASAKDAGFVVLLNRDAAHGAASEPFPLVLLAGGLAFLLSLVAVFLSFLAFVRPIEAIDQGVLEIINGDMDYWFDGGKKELVGTMAQNLNIMVCNLSGRPLPDEDDAPAA
ncbi:MAG: hypothetical protein H6702_01240 [Myxococcales bacterium]|nr:hypothetical protein [Myxococcales bacterium]